MTHRVSGVSENYTITQRGQDRFICAVMIQDGWERWEEHSLDEAVQSVIQAGKILNGMELTRENISIAFQENAVEAVGRKAETVPIDDAEAARRVLQHLADAENEFRSIKPKYPEDVDDFRRALKDAQRVLTASRMRRTGSDLWLSHDYDGCHVRP